MKDQTKIQLRKEFNKSFDAEYPSVRSYTAGKLQDFVADFWISKIDSLLQSQRDELVERIEKLYQDERPVDCIDGVTPVETYGYEATHNRALKQVISLINQNN